MKKIAAYSGNRKGGKSQRKKNLSLLSLALPAILSIFVFAYLPMFGLFISFKDINYSKGVFGSDWCGIRNFKFFFQSQDAWRVTRNTLLYNLAFILLGLGLAVVLAMVLYDLTSRQVKVFQTVLFMPYFLSWVIIGFVAYILLNPSAGVLNQILGLFGKESVNWYNAPGTWPFILVFFYLWKIIGYNAIIFYTGLMGIDESLYEAARIDGASRFQQKRCITLPLLKNLIIIMVVLAVGKIMFADFGLFYYIPKNTGSLYEVTDVIDTYVYRALRVVGDVGMSAAVSFYQSIVGFLLVFGTNFAIRKISPEDALF